MPTLVPTLRPSDKIRQYLLSQFGDATDESIKRLPTMRQLAAHLGVSLATVQSVYKSLSDEGYISTRAGVGSFFNPKPSPPVRQNYQIAIDISPPKDEAESPRYWMSGIYGGILHAMIQSSMQVNFLPLPPGDEGERLFVQRVRQKEVDGMLILGWRCPQKLKALSEQHHVPTMHLRVQELGKTTNFVSSHYFDFGRRAGEAFAAGERRRVLYLTNVTMGSSVGETLVFSGLASGLGDRLWRESELRFVNVHHEETACAELEKFIEETSYVPDAVFCSGDYLAIEALKALEKRKLKTPSQVSVIGASGVNLSVTRWPGLTRVHHPFDRIGELLVRSLVERIEKKGADLPGIFVDCRFGGGATTTAAENRLLGI